MDGMLASQICNETVPDFDTANVEFDKIWDLIRSSETTSILLNLLSLIWFIINYNTFWLEY